jgi:hypothetical protein
MPTYNIVVFAGDYAGPEVSPKAYLFQIISAWHGMEESGLLRMFASGVSEADCFGCAATAKQLEPQVENLTTISH